MPKRISTASVNKLTKFSKHDESAELKPSPKKKMKRAKVSDNEDSVDITFITKDKATGLLEEEKKMIKTTVTKQQKLISQVYAKTVLSAAEGSTKYIGAHVSAAGGVHNAIINAVSIGCRSFALFLKNQRRWESKPMADSEIQLWHKTIEENNYDLDKVVPHGSYLLNAASPVKDLRDKTRDSLIDEVKRCQKLGIKLYNFHPGSTTGKCTKEEGIQHIVDVLNQVFTQTKDVIILVETMAGQKNVIGGKFEDLKEIINGVDSKYKSRIGVCFDTCHVFAAGYDLRTKETYEKTMKLFENIVGLEYLKAVHLNDSLKEFNSGLDRHACINRGHLKSFFPLLMNDSRFENIPMILETPEELNYVDEMKYLYGLEHRDSK